MSEPRTPPAADGGATMRDDRIEQLVGRLLQFGVLVAAAVVVAGVLAILVAHGGASAGFGARLDEPALRALGSIVRGALALRPDAIVQLGVVLLIATPVARVALTMVAFALQRDRLYVAVSAVVLLLLIYGLVWGRA